MFPFSTIGVALVVVTVCRGESPLDKKCENGDFSDTKPELEEVGGSRVECVFKNRGDGHWFASPENATIVPKGLLTYEAAPGQVFKLKYTTLSSGTNAYVMESSPVPKLVGGVAILAAGDSTSPEGLPTYVVILICKDKEPAATFVKFFDVPSPEEVKTLNNKYEVPATAKIIKPCVEAAAAA